MATHTGSEGTVQLGANSIAEIRTFSIEETADTAEDTAMGDSYRTHKTTLKSWSGSVDVFWDETDTLGQVALLVGSELTIAFYPEGNVSTDAYMTGTAIVTSKSINSSFDGLVEASIQVMGTGALTQSTVA
jgi:hypothetical protein